MKKIRTTLFATSLAFALTSVNANAQDAYTLTPLTQEAVENIIKLSKNDDLAGQNEFFSFLEDKKYRKELKKTKALIAAGQQFLKLVCTSKPLNWDAWLMSRTVAILMQ